MAFSDLYELIDLQEVAAVSVINVYQVEKANPAFLAADIGQAYIDSVLPSILPVQHNTLEHTGVTVRSLDNPEDFDAIGTPGAFGTLGGNQVNNFTAATIQFNRRRTDMKNGQKRWAAGDETQTAGNLWTGLMLGFLTTLGNAVVLPWEKLVAPGVPVCSFVIIKRICTTSPSPPCVGGYRLPLASDPLKLYTPTTFLVRDTIRSQVSRKRLV